jgi:hypothetical protein
LKTPEEADVVLMAPLQNGQQVLVTLQSQLADMVQALLIEAAQNGPSAAGHHELLGLQDGADNQPYQPICSSA